MKIRKILLVFAAVLLCTASVSALTIEHTWVSSTGSDANPCTSASPCASFGGALAITTAGGLITAKDAGDFGIVAINQSVTIDGNNLASITFNSVSGAGVSIEGGANVTLQNLTINGLGLGAYGILDFNGGIVTVQNCNIMNFTNKGIFFEGAGNLTVENSRILSFMGIRAWGIGINSNAAENVVVKNTVIDASPVANNNSGFVVDSGSGSVKASLQNVTIMGAGNAAAQSNSGVAEITGSMFTQSEYGVVAYGGATVSVAGSLITANTTGVCSYASSKIRLDNNDIYDNTTAIANCGGAVKTSTTNKTSGTISIPASDVSESVTF